MVEYELIFVTHYGDGVTTKATLFGGRNPNPVKISVPEVRTTVNEKKDLVSAKMTVEIDALNEIKKED